MHTDEELSEMTRLTVAHYDERAEDFWEGTRDHDVSQNIHALLDALPAREGLRILDVGCGPGRDLKTFASLGHHPVGVEGSPRFCVMARAYAGVEVWNQDFLSLDLPDEHFDGIFANATLFHVPSQEIRRVLSELFISLRPGGALFSSNPRGENQEGYNGQRWGVYHDLESWTGMLVGVGFEPISHYYRPPGLPREEQPWLASTWRKPG